MSGFKNGFFDVNYSILHQTIKKPDNEKIFPFISHSIIFNSSLCTNWKIDWIIPNNKRITLNKILVNYPHIFLGSDRISYKKKIQIGPNSKNQILQMVQEKKLRKIKNLPKNSLVFYRKNLFCVV